MSWDDFLKHSGSGGGQGYLQDWKDAGSVDVWIVPGSAPVPRWYHQFWNLGKKRTQGGGEEAAIRMFRWNCRERESILRKQRFRNDDDSREYPPIDCPYDLTLEYVRLQVAKKVVSWTEPLFKFELPDDEKIVLVGEWCNLFSRRIDEYSKDQKAEMRRAGIDQRESFKTNGYAKLEYVMHVVADSDVGAGIVVTDLGKTLGERVQKAIKDKIERSKGKWSPNRDTICLRLKFDDRQSFEEKYDVVPLDEDAPSDAVLEAVNAEPPSFGDRTKLGDVTELRAKFEQYCLFDLPWGEFFDRAEEHAKHEATKGEDHKDEPWDKNRKAHEAQRATPKAAVAPAPEPEEPVGCDCCGKEMPGDAVECKSCGATYDPVTFALIFDPRTKPAAAEPATGGSPPKSSRKRSGESGRAAGSSSGPPTGDLIAWRAAVFAWKPSHNGCGGRTDPLPW